MAATITTTTTTSSSDPCAALLRITNEDSQSFTTRVIDLIIHNHPGYFNMTPSQKLLHHKQIQKEILERVRGCEQRIFNDPAVRYSFRKHFEREPGTMSNILTSGYFTLYNTLLQGPFGIQVNAVDDLKTLFKMIISLEIKNGKVKMDTDEYRALLEIIPILKQRAGRTNPFFTRKWFSDYITFLKNARDEALQKYDYMIKHPEARDASRIISWKLTKLSDESEEKKAIIDNFFAESYNHGLYEYFPPYFHSNPTEILIDEYIEKIPVVYLFFNNPDSLQQVQYPELPSSTRNSRNKTKKLTKSNSKGGKRRKRNLRPVRILNERYLNI